MALYKSIYLLTYLSSLLLLLLLLMLCRFV